MRKVTRKHISIAATCLGYSLLANPAQAVPSVTVNVDGKDYEITYFTGSYYDNTSLFQTPANNGSMPWWGNLSLANSFASAVELQLGMLNAVGGSNDSGPYFAIGPNEGNPYNDTYFYTVWSNINGTISMPVNYSGNYAYATATPIPAPGPLPLFGAAAAFGASRRLRRRIKLSA
jgi:hypothetical protein